MRVPPVRSILNGLGIFVAAMVAISAPAGYFLVGFTDAVEALAFKSQLSADRVAKYVFTHSDLWQ